MEVEGGDSALKRHAGQHTLRGASACVPTEPPSSFRTMEFPDPRQASSQRGWYRAETQAGCSYVRSLMCRMDWC